MSNNQTKLERKFARKVAQYCITHHTTPNMICNTFGYNNSVKINDFVSGKGSISSRTMGKIDEYMSKNK